MDENLYLRMARTFGFYAVATTACIAGSAALVEGWKRADHWAAVLALAVASMLWLAVASGLFLGARSPALPRLGRWVDRVLHQAPDASSR